ncbi:spore gernimation protein [Paenibacillus sp. Soil766]|uniref:GerAB/ArcD/ProY family transporter n=1 Tax=Paenibacillus sp. Soil766 TaxID=1736404 RepID=UPI000709889B|nr:GerAB/ArcD/ProY family transporter [Paenibacillus sp. Soil766]KRE92150.1 spore gernimation protein [Paenibacillus sp. Soil766]
MNKTTLELPELVSTLILFEIGSTTLFMIGSKAKQDAWIALGIAAAVGLVLTILHLAIYYRDSKRDLFELCRHYFGKWIGTIIGLAFACYFAYEASRVLRDLGELTTLVLLNRTPLIIILVIGLLVVGNTVRYGARVLFLTCLALFPVMILSYLFLVGVVWGTGLIDFKQIFPVLEYGWKPVWDAAFPEVVVFPFGQVVLFLVFLPMLKSRRKIRRSILLAYAFVVCLLIMINQLNFLVLGPTLVAKSTIPLLQIIQLIELIDVFERMDVLFVLILFMGLGIKMAAFYVGAVTGIHKLTGISYVKWVVPIGAIILGCSLISPTYTHHIWLGLKKVTPWFLVFQIGLPLMLFLVILVRQKINRIKPS